MAMGNPDYGMWDAQTVYHYDPRGKAFNIYIRAILVRPFSREAYETYCRMHESIDDVNQRLMLMWDRASLTAWRLRPPATEPTRTGRGRRCDVHVMNEEDDIEDCRPTSTMRAKRSIQD